jgi:hypothetical protein
MTRLWFARLGSHLYRLRTGWAAHITSCVLGNGTISLAVKRTGRGADHLSPSVAEIKNLWIYASTPP